MMLSEEKLTTKSIKLKTIVSGMVCHPASKTTVVLDGVIKVVQLIVFSSLKMVELVTTTGHQPPRSPVILGGCPDRLCYSVSRLMCLKNLFNFTICFGCFSHFQI